VIAVFHYYGLVFLQITGVMQ